MINYDLAWRRR